MTPQHIDAEYATLSCLMQADAHTAQDIVAITTEDHFHDPQNRLIWTAALTCVASCQTAHMTDIASALSAWKQLAAAGGRVRLSELHRIAPGASGWKKWWGQLEEARYRRAAINYAKQLILDAQDLKQPVSQVKDKAERSVLALDVHTNDDTGNVHQSAMEVLDDFQRVYETGQMPNGVLCGIEEFDCLLHGFRRAELTIIAARPSQGKSAIAMQMMENMSITGTLRGLFFSLEMSRNNLIQRQASSMSRVNLSDMAARRVTEQRMAALGNAITSISQSDIEIVDKSPVNIAFIQAVARRQHRKKPLDYIMLDYIQLVHGTTKRSQENVTLEIAETSVGLKNLAKELNVPVIALAQLNRDTEDRKGGMPKLSDLKGSGSLEQDGDMICLMSKDEEDETATELGHRTNFHWAKNRNGATGLRQLYFDRPYTRFKSIEQNHNA